MEQRKRYSIKRILLATLWVAVACGVAFLLLAGVHKNDTQPCKGIAVSIHGVNNNYFVDKADILNAMAALSQGDPVGKSLASINLRLMEKELKKNVWVKSVEMFFDHQQILQVTVNEREPIARVFNQTGGSFYIDNEAAMLPLSEKFSARIPVFTGFPVDQLVLSVADSVLLQDIRTVSLAIQKDSFRMAMIEQVDITPQRSFEMIPKMGNQLILFGDASDAEEKFRKLQLFYKKVMVNAGWNHYSVINVQYKGQVVARKFGAEDISADSIRTLQIMKMMADNAEKLINDSLHQMVQAAEPDKADSSMIQQSIQRDELPELGNETVAPVTPQTQNAKPVVHKPPAVIKKPPAPVKRPGH